MITKNSSGSSLNPNYASVVQGDSRSFLAKLFLNGTELDCDIVNLETRKGSCGSSGFSVGSIISNMLTCQLKNLTTGIKGEDIQVRIGLEISGSIEWIKLGTFTVTEAPSSQYVTNVTAYGLINSKTGAMISLSGSASIANLLEAVRTATGLTVTIDSSVDQTKVIGGSFNGLTAYETIQIIAGCIGGYATDTYDGGIAIHVYSDTSTLSVSPDLMTTPPEIEEQPFEIVGVLCHVSDAVDVTREISGSINISGTGTVDTQSLTWLLPTLTAGTAFTVSGTYTVNGSQETIYEELTYGTSASVVLASDEDETWRYTLRLIYYGDSRMLIQLNASAISFSVSAELTQVTYVEHVDAVEYPATPTGNENLVITNERMTADLFSSVMAPNLIGYEYYPASVELALGDPRIEGDDVLSVTDVAGNVWIVPCHEVRHKYDGGFSTQITAVDASEADDSLSASAPLSTKLSQISQTSLQAKAAADRAYNAAESAQTSANIAHEAADAAQASADEAASAAESAQADATRAQGSADAAQKSADNAQQSANQAFREMSYVENIVGVLELVAQKGVYEPTTDETVQADKWYFRRISTSPETYEVVTELDSVYHLTEDTDIETGKTYYTRTGEGTEESPYVYTAVETPIVAEIGSYYEKYYNLVDISDSIRNYVSNHIVLLNDGLWLRPDEGATQIHISTVTGNEGVIIYGADDKVVAKYGSTAIIGDPGGFHLEIGEIVGGVPEVGFYLGSSKVAYLNSEELYVENNLSFGHFVFTERANRHFTLKLIN